MAFDIAKYFPRLFGTKTPVPDTMERMSTASFKALSKYMEGVPNPDKVLQYESNGEGYQLYLDMPKKDPDLAGMIRDRSLKVAAKTWEVLPFDESDESEEIAQFCDEVLRRIPSFTDVKQKMAKTFWMGFSVAEVIWQISETGYITILDIRDRHQNRFRVKNDGNLQYRESAGSQKWLDLPPNKFLRLSYATDGENPYGTPTAQSCYLYWWGKLDAGIKNWLIASEKFAMPTVHGKHDGSLTTEEKANLDAALETVMADSYIRTSKNVEITLLEAMRNVSVPYQTLCSTMNQSLARSILGQTLTSSEGQNGTQALGKVHADVADDILQSDAEMIMGAIQQAVNWMVDFNFPTAAGYPIFVIKYEPEKDRAAMIDLFTKAANAGVPVPIAHVQEQLNLPTPVDGEPILESSKPVMPDAQGNPDGNSGDEQLSFKGSASSIVEVAKFFSAMSQEKDKTIAKLISGEHTTLALTSTTEGDGLKQHLQSSESALNLKEDPSRFLPGLPPISEVEGQPKAVQPDAKLKRYNIGSIATIQNRSRAELRKIYNGFVRAILSEFGQLPGGATAAAQTENMMQVIDDFILSDLKPNLQTPISSVNRTAIRSAAREMASQLGAQFNSSAYESMVTQYLRVHAFEATAFIPRATIIDGIVADTRLRFAAKVSEAIQSGGDLDEIVRWLKAELPQLADWKATQIAITEARTAANWAVLESGIRSGKDLEAWFITDPESCIVCQTWASMNPYNIRVAQAKGTPHPNCNDFFMLTPRGDA